jgi:hypothetical protein
MRNRKPRPINLGFLAFSQKVLLHSESLNDLLFPTVQGDSGIAPAKDLGATRVDGLVKSQKQAFPSFLAKVGIQLFQGVLDPGFPRGDGPKDFLRDHQNLKVRLIVGVLYLMREKKLAKIILRIIFPTPRPLRPPR